MSAEAGSPPLTFAQEARIQLATYGPTLPEKFPREAVAKGDWDKIAKELINFDENGRRALLAKLFSELEIPNPLKLADFLNEVLNMRWPLPADNAVERAKLLIDKFNFELGLEGVKAKIVRDWGKVARMYNETDPLGYDRVHQIPQLPQYDLSGRTEKSVWVYSVASEFGSAVARLHTDPPNKPYIQRAVYYDANSAITSTMGCVAEALILNKNPEKYTYLSLAEITTQIGGWPMGIMEKRNWLGRKSKEFWVFIPPDPPTAGIHHWSSGSSSR